MNKSQLLIAPIFTALLIICVLITPPLYISGIPLSLQPFLIALFAIIFDWKTTLTIVVLYILLGFIGLPVFSGGKNGAGALVSGTIGFVFGFIPFSLIISLPKHLFNEYKKRFFIPITLLFSLSALFILYGAGFVYFYFNSKFSFVAFFHLMSLFFLLDFVKIIIAIHIGIYIRLFLLNHLKFIII